MRRWLIKVILGPRLWHYTLGAIDLALEEWVGTIQDPAMQNAVDDMEFVEALQRRYTVVDGFWKPWTKGE